MPNKIEISHKTVIFTVVFLLSLWLLYQVREIIFLVFIALILMSACKPLMDYLDKLHIPRILSAIVVYILLIAFIGFSVSVILPPLVSQTIRFGDSLPIYLTNITSFVKIDTQTIVSQVAPLGENLIKFTVNLFSNIIAFFTVIIISFYLLIERENLEPFLSGLIGGKAAKNLAQIFRKVEYRLGAWVRGQVALGLVIGVLSGLDSARKLAEIADAVLPDLHAVELLGR